MPAACLEDLLPLPLLMQAHRSQDDTDESDSEPPSPRIPLQPPTPSANERARDDQDEFNPLPAPTLAHSKPAQRIKRSSSYILDHSLTTRVHYDQLSEDEKLVRDLEADLEALGLAKPAGPFADFADSETAREILDLATSQILHKATVATLAGATRDWDMPNPSKRSEGDVLSLVLVDDIIVDNPAPEELGDLVNYSLFSNQEHPERLSSSYVTGIPRKDVPFLLAPYPRPPRSLAFSIDALQCRIDVLFNTIKLETLKNYALTIIRYIEFCDRQFIPVERRFPADREAVLTFLCEFQGLRRADTISKYLDGLRFWHSVHSLEMDMPRDIWLRHKRGMRNLEPAGREPRPPATYKDLIAIYESLDHTKPSDICFWAACSVSFFAIARPGDVTLRTLDAFDSTMDANGKGVRFVAETKDFPAHAVVFLPYGKVEGKNGEELIVTEQLSDPRLCPLKALKRHLEVNAPGENDFLFSSIPWDASETALRPLTASYFIKHINELLKPTTGHQLSGHSMRIGGCTFYLLCDHHPDLVRMIGRWCSDSFLRYWRRVKIIAARELSNSQLIDPGEGLPAIGAKK